MEICPSLPTIKTVISTEAGHNLIVSSEAKKSAFLPKQHLSHRRVYAVALVFAVAFDLTIHKSPGAPSIANFAMGGMTTAHSATMPLPLSQGSET
jgi:hypothetical protein